MIHPKDLTISVWHVKSQASQMFVEQNFLPNLKIRYRHYCPFVKRIHRSLVKSHHKGPVIRKGFQFISPTCYVSYLIYMCEYATVNTAIIYLYHDHGLLSVRYVALYDRIEMKWHVFVQNSNRLIGEKINKHFPWKMPGRCPGTSILKNNVSCATEGRSTLLIFLSQYCISYRRLLRYF